MKLCFTGDYAPAPGDGRVAPDGIAVGNLECAFADGEVGSEKAYASILPRTLMDRVGTSGFAALSLANNHVNDAGNFEATYGELKRRFPAIQFFGTVDNPYAVFDIVDGERGEGDVLTQRSREAEVLGALRAGGATRRKVIVIGCLESCRSRGKAIFRQEDVTALIHRLRSSPSTFDLHPSSLIFIYPHWGKEGEYTRYPSPAQRRLAREWIAAGADGVIGNHAHVPQGLETVDGKPVFYCLGNFSFPLGETDAYPASRERMVVAVNCGGGERAEPKTVFAPESAAAGFEAASSVLDDRWTLWRWAQAVGPVMLAKNTASWKIRLKKNFLKTLPKFLVWQCLPQVLLFRVAAAIGGGEGRREGTTD